MGQDPAPTHLGHHPPHPCSLIYRPKSLFQPPAPHFGMFNIPFHWCNGKPHSPQSSHSSWLSYYCKEPHFPSDGLYQGYDSHIMAYYAVIEDIIIYIHLENVCNMCLPKSKSCDLWECVHMHATSRMQWLDGALELDTHIVQFVTLGGWCYWKYRLWICISWRSYKMMYRKHLHCVYTGDIPKH